MPIGPRHNLEHPRDKISGHRLMENIAHTVYKNTAGLSPPQGLL
jgi:hypothetical protein